MKKQVILIFAIGLCLLAAPVMAEEEEGGLNELYPGDNIWIAISPMETHPMLVDRPAAIIPTIPGYPIRVAVYSNPYIYAVLGEDDGEIYDPYAMDFDVTVLDDLLDDPNYQITLRLPDPDSTDEPNMNSPEEGAEWSKIHQENEYKYQFVFYERDLEGLNADIQRLFFVVSNISTGEEVIEYQGSGAVMVTATSQKGGSGGPPEGKGSGNGRR